MSDPVLRLKKWLRIRYRLQLLRRTVPRAAEAMRYAFVRPTQQIAFHIVSSERNAGSDARKCLDSVYGQNYPRNLVRHVYIDDNSPDDTDAHVLSWLEEHPDHNVDYIRTSSRLGGASNNLNGFRRAATGTIILELNGDDWLPDPELLTFLNKVYCDDAVWMTYNTCRFAQGCILQGKMFPIPNAVTRDNSHREAPWVSSALHTFRSELLDHFDESCMIDPESGEYWENADDQAFYLALLELAGTHTRHLYRVTYIYNFRESSEFSIDRDGQTRRADAIRLQKRFDPLENLASPMASATKSTKPARPGRAEVG